MKLKRTAALFICMLALCTARAQNWEVGLMAGGAGYIGDLNPINPVKISGISGGVFVKRHIDSYFGVSFQYNYGHIQADDADSKYERLRNRNLNFRTGLNEASLVLDFNFLEYVKGSRRRFINPYLFAGAGLVFFQPKTTFDGKDYELAQYGTEGQVKPYNNFIMTIPFGAGVRYNLKDNISVFSQVGYRNPFTDYLDDVSGSYPDAAAFQNSSDPMLNKALSDRSGEVTNVYLGRPGTQRGDFRKRDTYMFVGIGISYTFVSSKCF